MSYYRCVLQEDEDTGMGPPCHHISSMIRIDKANNINSISQRFGHLWWQLLGSVPIEISPCLHIDVCKGGFIESNVLRVKHNVESLMGLEVGKNVVERLKVALPRCCEVLRQQGYLMVHIDSPRFNCPT